MRLIIKPIKKPKDNSQINYREFDEVIHCYVDDYPVIKLVHKSNERYVMMRVPDDCYIICEKE